MNQDNEIAVVERPDGSFFAPGRHGTFNGKRGVGSARICTGEAAEVLRLLFKHRKEVINANS